MDFKEIPFGWKVPGNYAEIDNSRAAGSGEMPFKALVIGQPTKTVSEEVAISTSDDDSDAKYGAGSQLALMLRAFRKNAPSVELYALPIADEGTTRKTAVFSFADSASEGGDVVFAINGINVKTSVSAGTAAADVAEAVATSIGKALPNASTTQYPVYASVATNSVTIHAKNAGTCGNAFAVKFVSAPNGLKVTAGAVTEGASEPNLGVTGHNVVAKIAHRWFNVVAMGMNGDDNAKVLDDEMKERWTALKQTFGTVFYGVEFGTFAARQSYYEGLNTQALVPVSLSGAPGSSWERAARVAGVVAESAKSNPALTITNIELVGEVAPSEDDDLSDQEKNILLDYGCSDIDADQSSRTVYVRRIVTTYKRNSAGASDRSYSQVETSFCLSYFRWGWNNRMASKYPRTNCAPDNARFGIGVQVLRPSTVKAEAIEYFDDLEARGICYGHDDFVKNLYVEIDPNDKNRINCYLPPNFVNQMFIIASKIAFA